MTRKCMVLVIVLSVFLSPATAQLDKGKFTLGLFGSAVKLVGGEVDNSNVSPWAGVTLGYTVSPLLTLMVNGGYGWVRPMDMTIDGIGKHFSTGATGYKTVLIPILANLKLNLNPAAKFNPYLTVGGGALLWDLMLDDNSENGQQNTPMIDGGLGLEWFLTEAFGIDLSAHYQYLANQDLDMSGLGDVQTGVVEARLGFNFYFGGKRDTDKDGVLDKIDNCPNEAEDLDNFQDEDGCPDYDNDKDGVADTVDRCPGVAGHAANRGCPDIDTDKDGIVNRLDKCRRAPEDMDGFLDEDGCPDYDNDKDGIPDTLDKCRDVAGLAENNGCPDVDSDNDGIIDRLDKCPNNPGVAETQGCPQTKEITREGLVLRGVNFRVGKADILETSWPVLDEVVRSLKEWPEVRVEIQGHTDITGSAETNRILSQQRADAVMAYFIERGIASSRLTAVGYGPDMPVADNRTASGRAKNRRVELKRLY
ncbi:MAG: OmpA family protein [Chitinispirillaceae bacterium]|nr:OmpA family protein [Chitinispirillaceae bacterium]